MSHDELYSAGRRDQQSTEITFLYTVYTLPSNSPQ